MCAHKENILVLIEYIICPVAMMHIEVKNHHLQLAAQSPSKVAKAYMERAWFTSPLNQLLSVRSCPLLKVKRVCETYPLQPMELLRMPGCNADAPKEAEAHGSLWHSMVTWRPTNAKASWRRLLRAAVLHHSIHQCHCRTGSL